MTMQSEREKIEALRADFQYIDGDTGAVLVTVGFTASFFFWGGHTVAKRLALADCFDAYKEIYGTNLTWMRDPDSWKAVKLGRKEIPPLRDVMNTMDEDDTVDWFESSGDREDEAGDYTLYCLTERGWQEHHTSCFQLQVPLEHAFDQEKLAALEALITLCIKKLQPFHGVAGLASTTIEDMLEVEPETLDLTTRYRALYTENIVADRRHAPNGIKGVNWLTYIGDLLTERLGGPQVFAAYCTRFGITPIRTGNGFMIRAGESPQLGPVNEPPPEAYVRANAAIRPLRNGRYGSMGSGSIHGELRFNRCTSDLWIRRFDGPAIWPPATFAGLPRGPLGTPPAKKVVLRTGRTCEVHGRYRKLPIDPELFHNDEEYDRTPLVVLLPGDLAPFYLALGPHGEFVSRDIVTWELSAKLGP